jgi:hypothetical protein
MTLAITQNTHVKVQKYSQMQILSLVFSKLKVYFHCTHIFENPEKLLFSSPIIF